MPVRITVKNDFELFWNMQRFWVFRGRYYRYFIPGIFIFAVVCMISGVLLGFIAPNGLVPPLNLLLIDRKSVV